MKLALEGMVWRPATVRFYQIFADVFLKSVLPCPLSIVLLYLLSSALLNQEEDCLCSRHDYDSFVSLFKLC